MEFAKDQYVVYNGTEICRIGEKVIKNFDGVNESEYFSLFPKDSKSTYYVPADKINMHVRPILSKQQLLDIIDRIPSVKGEWIDDRNDRKTKFYDAVRNGDYERILPMMSGLYSEENKRAKTGKHLFLDDKKNFEWAKKLLHSEIAFSFGITVEEAEKLIVQRISGKM